MLYFPDGFPPLWQFFTFLPNPLAPPFFLPTELFLFPQLSFRFFFPDSPFWQIARGAHQVAKQTETLVEGVMSGLTSLSFPWLFLV